MDGDNNVGGIIKRYTTVTKRGGVSCTLIYAINVIERIPKEQVMLERM